MNRRSFLKYSTLGAGALTTASMPAPAVAQDRIDMTIVGTFGRDFPGLGTSAQRLAARIEELTDGRIHVEYYAGGEKVGPLDVFDDAASGNSQAYISGDYYWKGKHPGLAVFTAVPFGLTYTEMDAWIKYGGGQELWDELSGEFGLKPFAAGNTGTQMGGWFNKEINSVSDIKGLKIRIPGLGSDVMTKVGAAPVSVPGGQIYENLVSGAIEATEWVGPYNDYFMKFHEAAQYYYWPGMHEPGAQLSMGINASWWGALSANDQAIIEAACNEENGRHAAEANANNGTYLKRLVEEHGVELREFSDEIYESFGEAAQEVIEESRDHSDLSKRIFDSFLDARQEIGSWTTRADAAYAQKRQRVLDL